VIDKNMQALIDAPLANAAKINIPAGRRSSPRAKKLEYDDGIGCPKVSPKELRERKDKAASAKLDALFDYYATTELSPERVAQHMGLYRNIETGIDDKGRPAFTRVLDVELATAQLAWRRK
jgi:hypothetical protein